MSECLELRRQLVQRVEGYSTCLLDAADTTEKLNSNDVDELMTEVARVRDRLLLDQDFQ